MEQSLQENLSEFSTVSKKNLDELVGLVEELVINKVRIEKIKNELSNNVLSNILDQELRIISEIQDSIKKVRLVKMKTIENALMDLVKELCEEYNKDIQFIFKGQETEIENSLIYYIHKILIYCIKDIFINEFKASTKEPNYIKIECYSNGENLVTTIESNGKSFEYDEVCKALNKKELDLSTLNEEELKKFLSLINTSNNLQGILKLRSDLEYLNSSFKYESELNKFMRRSITIPLSTSIMQGLLVSVADQIFAIPLEFIETIINKNAVSSKNSNNTEMIVYMDHVIQLINVADLLKLEGSEEASCILIVSAYNKRAALLVDSLLDQTDMVIKPKHRIIKDVQEIKGTTILGDGLVTLVLDVPSILKRMER